MNRDRVCCYFTSPDDGYALMTAASLRSLRDHDPDLKVRVFLIEWGGANNSAMLERECGKLSAELVRRPATGLSEESGCFGLNRAYLAECPEESVLCLDSDTFVFGRAGTMFDRYAGPEFAAGLDRRVGLTPGWDWAGYEADLDRLGLPPAPVFQCGVVLWNRGAVRRFAGEIDRLARAVRSPESSLAKWAFNQARTGTDIDSWATNFYAAGSEWGVMGEEVAGVQEEGDTAGFFSRTATVAHCYPWNWAACRAKAPAVRKPVRLSVL